PASIMRPAPAALLAWPDSVASGDVGALATSDRRTVTEPPELSARFLPSRRASRVRRRTLLIAGPLLWLVAVIAVALVVHRTHAVEYALLVLAASFGAAVVLLGWTRAARARRERDL